KRGFTPQAEIWNGRLAMIGLSVAILAIVLLRLV
ncbi:MAG: high light inducible protein, partial [Synechococcus sp. SB0662_bin_45]|nr:high light inducible protein [Synechococcus sp. SB0662_bin_45]